MKKNQKNNRGISNCCSVISKIIYFIPRFIELSLFGHARDVLFDQDNFIKTVLTPAAIKDHNGLAYRRVSPCLPFSQTRHLAVIIPKSMKDLDVFLKEIEDQPDGRSILNPFTKMVGETLSNNTGEFAMKERHILLNYTGNVQLFYPIIQAHFKDFLNEHQGNEFILLDEIKILIRRIATNGMIGGEVLTTEENNHINLCFKGLKEKISHPYSIETAINFNQCEVSYKTASREFIDKHIQDIRNGLEHPKTNVLSDIIRSNIDPLDSIMAAEEVRKLTKDSMLVVGALDGIYINLVGTVLQMIKYPDIIKNLRKELDQTCETDENGYRTLKLNDLTNYDHLPTYLDQVIKEGLRYISSAPLLPRYTSIGVNYSQEKIKIPPHTTILINLSALHHDSTHWGDDANEFNPDRWTPDRMKATERFKGEYFLPFSSGPRPCPGINVGLVALRSFISQLFLNYDLVAMPGQDEPRIDTKSALVMDIGPEYKVMLQKRYF